MTINEIKEHLPEVKVVVNGKTYTARTMGRKLDFCKVYIPVNGMFYSGQSWDYSWDCIARAVNNNTALLA